MPVSSSSRIKGQGDAGNIAIPPIPRVELKAKGRVPTMEEFRAWQTEHNQAWEEWRTKFNVVLQRGTQ